MHTLEISILAVSVIVCFMAVYFIPKAKAAEASFIFLMVQFFTWLLGLIAVQSGWLEYPVRELSKANSTSFLFEYLVLPIISIFFILYYPYHKPLYNRIMYSLVIVSSITLFEVILENYTLIIKYHAWKWYWTWISISFVFYIDMVIYKWFFKMRKIFSL